MVLLIYLESALFFPIGVLIMYLAKVNVLSIQ